MKKSCVPPAFSSTVNLCMAADDAYATHLRVTLYSLLCNRDTSRTYDILVLYHMLSDSRKEQIAELAKGQQGVSIRLIDIETIGCSLPGSANAYYSAAINYRLTLFDTMFSKYDKMLYLDSDTIVLGDVSVLFDTELGEAEIAAVRAEDFRLLAETKKAIYLDNCPYHVDNYRKDGLGMTVPENYFNSGVLLLDLEKARRRMDMKGIEECLFEHDYMYSDQDVLNRFFDGKVKVLDCCWNYMTCIEENLRSGNPYNERLYADLKRESPAIIHYVGHKKPWNSKKVLGEYYWHYHNKLEG